MGSGEVVNNGQDTTIIGEATIGVLEWQKRFADWSGDLGTALAPFKALQEDIEFYSESDDEQPRPAMIQAEVKSALAMMPMLKVLLGEMQNWPNGPTVRKPRAAKDKKK